MRCTRVRGAAPTPSLSPTACVGAAIAEDASAVANLTASWPRALLTSIAANEAQQLTVLRQALGAGPRPPSPMPSRTAKSRPPVEDDPSVTAPLYAIGRFCSRHHWPVIGLWLIAAVALVLAGQASGSKTNDNLTLPGTDSTNATNLLENNLPQQAYGSNPLVIASTGGAKLTQAQVRDRDRPDRQAPEREGRRQLRRQPAHSRRRLLPQQRPHRRLRPRRPRRRPRRPHRG